MNSASVRIGLAAATAVAATTSRITKGHLASFDKLMNFDILIMVYMTAIVNV